VEQLIQLVLVQELQLLQVILQLVETVVTQQFLVLLQKVVDMPVGIQDLGETQAGLVEVEDLQVDQDNNLLNQVIQEIMDLGVMVIHQGQVVVAVPVHLVVLMVETENL
tara:strand:- start:37 stop:363 length:327 start_codon:yes stop_codon:yes gene_type:complete